MNKLILNEYAGQRCPVELNKRENGSVWIQFKMEPGYGYPSLEEKDLEKLLSDIKTFKKVGR